MHIFSILDARKKTIHMQSHTENFKKKIIGNLMRLYLNNVIKIEGVFVLFKYSIVHS